MKSSGKKNKPARNVKDVLLKLFLGVSIVFSVLLVNNCDLLTNFIDGINGNGGVGAPPPDFGGSESGSYATTLFKSVAEGAAGEIGGSAVSWALGALGLSDSSPDYTDQLNKIDQDLQEIIAQLNGIQNELDKIDNDLNALKCSDYELYLQSDIKLVDTYMDRYQNMIKTASSGTGIETDSTISDWVDQVLAQKQYVGNTAMDVILNDFETTLIQAGNTGSIPACIETITPPVDNSFGTDTIYYNQVKTWINYYYIWQVKALFLFNEAKHYSAWAAVGKPNSNYLSADSISSVCSNTLAGDPCNAAISATNKLYNNLVNQFTLGGESYTDDNLVLMYNHNGPYLWPKSLEDFTISAGDNCADPLNSANPCGITAGFYTGGSMQNVTFKGYTGWLKAGNGILTNLLAGWNSGTAGNYLQTKLGFKNMNNKIIISSNLVSVGLSNSSATISSVCFFDTDFDHSFIPGLVSTSDKFNIIAQNGYHSGNTGCGYDLAPFHYDFFLNSYLTFSRNGFYNIVARTDYYIDFGDVVCNPFRFYTEPGWYAGNKGSSAKQFRMPVLLAGNLACTENRSNKNTAGVYTMCGDDFTAFIEYNVPRPVTCDNTNATPCNVSSSTVAKAKSVFGDNFKSKRKAI